MAQGELKLPAFLRASAHNFVPFLLTVLMMSLIIGLFTVLIVGVPVGVMMAVSKGSLPPGPLMIVLYSVWGLAIPVWLFVADHSRRWIAATGSRRIFRALGQGFSALKKHFWQSYFNILVVVILNAVYIVAVFWIAGRSIPQKGILVFLFFITTQALFFIRLYLRAWRYATVSELALLP